MDILIFFVLFISFFCLINKVKIELEAKKKKLSNKNFLNKAKKDVVEKQKSIKDELEFRLPKLLQAKAVLEGNEPS